jgi:hypothetical protein
LINPIAKFKANNEIDFIYQSLRHPEKESV